MAGRHGAASPIWSSRPRSRVGPCALQTADQPKVLLVCGAAGESAEIFKAEGEFVTSILSSLHDVSAFYLAKESELTEQLHARAWLAAGVP